MNFTELAENLGLDKEEYVELIDLYIETGKSDLAKLQSAIAAGDVEEAAGAAHSLKGASGNLGLTELYEAAKNIEEKARNSVLEGAAEAIRVIGERLDHLAEQAAG